MSQKNHKKLRQVVKRELAKEHLRFLALMVLMPFRYRLSFAARVLFKYKRGIQDAIKEAEKNKINLIEVLKNSTEDR